MVRAAVIVACLLVAWLQPAANALPAPQAEAVDPFDPFSTQRRDALDFGEDEGKTAEELLFEGTLLLDDERPLDARSKLLKALQKDPTEYRAHLLLAGYYMVHVGHFQLALKYVKQAQKLFHDREGDPPYLLASTRQQHQRILYLLSQARLSLDDYEGALEVLDEFSDYGYYADWYPGSRAWILMKLGRLDDAIKEARTGIYSGAETGRTLNMLGILLSMTGDRAGSVEVFKQAIAYEFSLGNLGQPATPLNNVGEVYEEIFNEALAQSSYSRATSLPDGCEHVLPSLNLAKLYLDELNYSAAKRTMDNFDGCIAQFPLRNGEEHRALVHLARGRIALMTGHIREAIDHFREVLAERQWFGKIGTSQDDLYAAGSISLAQALLRRNASLAVTPRESFWELFGRLKESAENSTESWWLMRRGRQVLIDNLKNIEDLYIRNTDSMIEYPTFGEALAPLSRNVLTARIEEERAKDSRATALTYYTLYLAEQEAYSGSRLRAAELLDTVISRCRPQFDNALKLRAMLVKLGLLDSESNAYRALAEQIFALSRPALRSHGFQLPVRAETVPNDVRSALRNSPFLPTAGAEVAYALSYSEDGGKLRLALKSTGSNSGATIGRLEGTGETLDEALTSLSDAAFQINLE